MARNPQQNLAEVTGGAVFHDGLGTLEPARRRLAWYPDQVWRYLLACQWQRLSDEEAFVGRCAEVGDELGSAVVASRLVRDMMRLCLLLERRHAPYSKWLASAFAELPVATALIPSLEGAVSARDHPTRERHLCTAYETVAQIQNRSGLAEALDPACRTYHGRPYMVLHAERFAIALHETVTDPILRRVAAHRRCGPMGRQHEPPSAAHSDPRRDRGTPVSPPPGFTPARLRGRGSTPPGPRVGTRRRGRACRRGRPGGGPSP